MRSHVDQRVDSNHEEYMMPSSPALGSAFFALISGHGSLNGCPRRTHSDTQNFSGMSLHIKQDVSEFATEVGVQTDLTVSLAPVFRVARKCVRSVACCLRPVNWLDEVGGGGGKRPREG